MIHCINQVDQYSFYWVVKVNNNLQLTTIVTQKIGPLAPSSVAGYFIMNNYAKFSNGLIVALEHRFYGKSMPKPDLSTESLRYLSSQQALADAAVFRQFLVKKYNLSQKTKFVVLGGSYSGNL
jgi:serine protease 16